MPLRLVSRLGEFDVRDRFAPHVPGWLSQILFAVFCIGVEVILRAIINIVAPGVAPFALLYPAVLAAALFAGWQAGLLVLLASELLAWYFLLNAGQGFGLPTPADGPRLVVIAIAGVIVIGLAEIFRHAVRTAARERSAQLEERDLLLREIDHRVKNNFMMVSSLIDIQRRRSSDEDVKEALTTLLSRVESFSRAHRHLYRDGNRNVATVDIRGYINELCETLSQALTLHGGVTLTHSADAVLMDRDRAVSIGLLINELVTNAAKHAFTGRENGNVNVMFRRSDTGWRLTVEDNGIGMDAARANASPQGGLGSRLVEAFARQANATLNTETSAAGTRVTADFAA